MDSKGNAGWIFAVVVAMLLGVVTHGAGHGPEAFLRAAMCAGIVGVVCRVLWIGAAK